MRNERRGGRLFYNGKELPPGEWHDEPDRVDFEAHGFPCILKRAGMGAWCGYVGMPPGHPWHGTNDVDADVHGGITYAARCDGEICHVSKPGQSDDVWWLGFDCNHYNDLAPALLLLDAPFYPGYDGEYLYRTVDVARQWTEQLAKQAAIATEATS